MRTKKANDKHQHINDTLVDSPGRNEIVAELATEKEQRTKNAQGDVKDGGID